MNIVKAAIVIMVAMAMALPGLPAPAGADAVACREADSDNDPGSATNMTAPAVYPASLSSSDDQVDYYSAASPNWGQVFNVSVNVTTPGMKVRLVAYDYNQVFLEESNVGDTVEALSIIAVRANLNYFFAVYLTAGSGGNYVLSYSLETPTPIVFGDTKLGQLARVSDNAGDWYMISLTGGKNNPDNATFTVSHDLSIALDVYFYVMWPEYVLHSLNISLNHVSGQTISGLATITGPYYYLKVWARSGSGGYRVGATNTGGQPGPDYYDGDHCQRLTGAVATGTLDQAYHHISWYRLYLTAGQTLRLRMNLTNSTSGKYSIYIFSRSEAYFFYLGNASNYVPGVGWTNYVELVFTPSKADFYMPIPSADQGQDPDGTVNSINAHTDYTLKVVEPDPLNHAPVIVQNLGVPPVPEDTEAEICNLNAVFTEPDEDQMSFCVTDSPPNLTAKLGGDGRVYVKGGPNWYGLSSVVISATDSGGLTTSEEVRVQVTSVNDKPVVLNKIGNLTLQEDVPFPINLSEYFYDPDVNDQLTYGITGNAPIPATIDGSLLTLGPMRGWIGTKETRIRVHDQVNPPQWVSQAVFITVNHTNHSPNATQPVLYISLMEDDVNNSVNVKPLFTDPDTSYAGDVLKLKAIDSEHVNLTILPDGRLEVRPMKNWNGEEMAYVVAEDTGNLTATIEVTVTVIADNDPPEILEWWPVGIGDYEVKINETDRLELSINATDIDTPAASMTYAWFINDDDDPVMGASGPRFTFITDLNSAGNYIIRANVSDGQFNASHVWSVLVQDKNQPVVVNITSPLDGMIYPEVGLLRLAADATDPEHDPINAIWKEGNTTIGRTLRLNYHFTPGNHMVTVYVDDGTDITQKSVSFFSDSVPTANITAPEDGKHFKEGTKIQFSSDVFDRDGNTVIIEWREGNNVVARTANFTKKLSKGSHDLYLVVTDGRNPVQSRVTVVVDAAPVNNPIPSLWPPSLLVAAALAAGAAAILRRSRRRNI